MLSTRAVLLRQWVLAWQVCDLLTVCFFSPKRAYEQDTKRHQCCIFEFDIYFFLHNMNNMKFCPCRFVCALNTSTVSLYCIWKFAAIFNKMWHFPETPCRHCPDSFCWTFFLITYTRTFLTKSIQPSILLCRQRQENDDASKLHQLWRDRHWMRPGRTYITVFC